MKKLKKVILCSVLALSTAFSSLSIGSLTAGAITLDDVAVSAESSISSVGAKDYGLADNIQDGVILHCFDWKYNDIKAELPNIAEAGFTAVQTSPAQPADSSGTWYWLYQPLGFYIGTNDLGTKSDLQSLCTEAEKYGIKVVVDVVANHLTGDHSRIDNDQTSDIYLSGFEGYYTDGSRDSSGHLNAIGRNSNINLLKSSFIGDSSASLADEVAAWPGVKMTYDSATGYYVTEVPEGYEDAYVIFTEGENATTNRYPADLEPGLPLEGVTKLFSANHSFEPYNPVTPTEPTTQPTHSAHNTADHSTHNTADHTADYTAHNTT